MASGYLIPRGEYEAFLRNENFADPRDIRVFSEKVSIAPCIVVGRLLHDKLVDFGAYDFMRPSFEVLS